MFVVNDLKILLKKVKTKFMNIPTEKDFVKFFNEYRMDRDLVEIEQIMKNDANRDVADVGDLKRFFARIHDIDYKNLIEENPYYSAGVFFLPKGSKLPLHDHRNMLVFCKLIYGRAEFKSYDKLKDRDLDTDKFEVKLTESKIYQEGEINVVTPSNKNLHEITALEDTAIFDVLVPDYTEINTCHYFTMVNENNKTILHKNNFS